MSSVAKAGTLAFILAALFAATGTFKEQTGLFQAELTREHLTDYLLLVLAILVVTILVFWLVVGRAVRSGRPSTTGLVLSVLGILSIIVVWSGLPAILGTGGAFLGMEARKAGAKKGQATAALVVGTLAVLVNLWGAIFF